MKYAAPGTAPEPQREFQLWVKDELQHVADAMSELETDTVLSTEWHAEPNKLYDGLQAYADGSDWNPGSGQGFYGYYAAAWHFLG